MAHALKPVPIKQFDDFLGASRVLVNLLPLTRETRGILNRDTLSKLNGGRRSSRVVLKKEALSTSGKAEESVAPPSTRCSR